MGYRVIRWKVKEFLQAHDITPYRLMKDSGLAQGTAYRLANNDVGAVNNETLDAVIKALRERTGEEVKIQDLVEYYPDSDE